MQGSNAKPDTLSIFVYLLYTGIVILFLGLSYGYISSLENARWDDFNVPKIFWLSSVCVITISMLLNNMYRCYKKDALRVQTRYISVTLFVAVAFVLCQIFGWMHLYTAGLTLTDTPAAGYIYVLSGLHALHVLAGVVFLAVALIKVQKAGRDPVTILLYTSDASQATRLKLLTHYWHTIDALWLFIFFMVLYRHA